MKESSDLLTLGLLFGEDVDATSSDLPEVLSFQHKLIQEMVAAYYIAEQVEIDPSFLKTAFPTWEKVDEHREVVKFTSGLLAQNAAPVINYVGKMNYDRQRCATDIISMFSENTEESAVIQDLDTKDPIYQFLETAYKTSEKIIEHEEKLEFICELLFESYADATSLVNHVAQVFVREIWEELNRGKVHTCINEGNEGLDGIEHLQNAGKISNVNPHLCQYPEYCGGRPLAKVFNNTKLAVINNVDENDPLNVQHSTADVILRLQHKAKETCSKLVKALHSAQANLLALHLDGCNTDEDVMEELAAYIDSFGPQQQLRYCYLGHETSIPSSLLTSLSKCKQLMCIDMGYCDLGSRLHILLSDPPPPLRVLVLRVAKLCAEDVEQIADCVRSNLRELDISCNSVGEEAVRGLLEAFLITRRQSKQHSDQVTNVENEHIPQAPSHKGNTHSDKDKLDQINNMEGCCDDVSGDEDEEDEKLELRLGGTAAVGEDEGYKDLSDEFIEEWKQTLENTNIEVTWHY